MGFLASDQYAGYVFACYGVTALALGAAVTWTVLAWRRARARLAALEKNR